MSDFNLTASVSAWGGTHSAISLVGVLIVAVFIIMLASTRFFMQMKSSLRLVARVLYYFLIGCPVFGCGYVIYRALEWLQQLYSEKVFTLRDVGIWLLWFLGLSLLGFLSDKVLRRIYENLKAAGMISVDENKDA